MSDKLPKKAHVQAKLLLTKMPYTPTCGEADRVKAAFGRWCEKRGYRDAAHMLDHDWDRLVTFHRFPICALEAPADDQSG